jgi:hypothetical protein
MYILKVISFFGQCKVLCNDGTELVTTQDEFCPYLLYLYLFDISIDFMQASPDLSESLFCLLSYFFLMFIYNNHPSKLITNTLRVKGSVP